MAQIGHPHGLKSERADGEPLSTGPPMDFVVIDGLCPEKSLLNLEHGVKRIIERGYPGSRIWRLAWGKTWNPDWYYGYPSYALVEVARDILSSVASARESDRDPQRPILFIGASLGGIVVKQAILLAQITGEFQSIRHYTKGVIFLGTPHLEDGDHSYAQILARFGQVCNRHEAADAIAVNSDYLQQLTFHWGRQLGDLPVYTIIHPDASEFSQQYTDEMNEHRPVISRTAATIGTEGEVRVPLRRRNLRPDELDEEYLAEIFRCVEQIAQWPLPSGTASLHQDFKLDNPYSSRDLPPEWCPICSLLPPNHLPVGRSVPPLNYTVGLDLPARNTLRLWARCCALANYTYYASSFWLGCDEAKYVWRGDGWVSDYKMDFHYAQSPCYIQRQKAGVGGGSWSVEDVENGCVIFTGKPQPRINEEFSLSVEHDVTFRHNARCTVVHQDPLSQVTQRQIKSWIKNCDHNHNDSHTYQKACNNTQDWWLPSRLLDIRNPNKVTLLDSRDLQDPQHLDDDKRYTALSHCWGSSRDFLTTTASLPRMKKGFSLSGKLPKTFSDAIIVAHTLGIPYLWIDSLCIIQDDSSDWAAEASQMANVYSASYLTIAAAASDSDDKGFLHPRPFLYFPIKLRSPTGEYVTAYLSKRSDVPSDLSTIPPGDEPLFTRAWVLQEQYLSPRSLVFSKEQTYFLCQAANDSPKGENIWKPLKLHPQFRRIGTDWRNIAEQLSGRGLTYDTDKLPSVAGIASSLSLKGGRRPTREYCAGMWRDTLPLDFLFWWVGEAEFPSRYLAPSWSWVSRNGQVRWMRELDHSSPTGAYWSLHMSPLDTVKVVDCNVLLSDPRATYGQVNRGCSLIICAHLIALTPYENGSQEENASPARMWLPRFPVEKQTPHGLHVAGKGPLDSSSIRLRRKAVWCGFDTVDTEYGKVMGLVVASTLPSYAQPDKAQPWTGLLGLLVTPVGLGGEEGKPQGYKRVGLFEIVTPKQKVAKRIARRFPATEVALY